MSRTWTCQRQAKGVKCAAKNPARKRLCTVCGKPRPKRSRPAHMAILNEMPYEAWEAAYGARCGICGALPKTRRLDRDHDHKTGLPRGLLCHRCNRTLGHWLDAAWLRAAADYLDRTDGPVYLQDGASPDHA